MAKKVFTLNFHTGDWLKSPDVRSLDFESKGLWIDMLAIMSECVPRGYLTLNGQPMSVETLAKLTGSSIKTVDRILLKLKVSGVTSETNGILYSRRMVRDEEKRMKAIEDGKKGGNPQLKTSKGMRGRAYPERVNPMDNPIVNLTDNPEMDQGVNPPLKLLYHDTHEPLNPTDNPKDSSISCMSENTAEADISLEPVRSHRKSQNKPKHPLPFQIQALRDFMLRTPKKDLWEGIIEKFGEGEIDLPKLKHVFSEWCLKGYNPHNYDGIINWYLHGVNSYQSKGNGKSLPPPPKRPNGCPETAEYCEMGQEPIPVSWKSGNTYIDYQNRTYIWRNGKIERSAFG